MKEQQLRPGNAERLPRVEAGKHLLDECRMVLPGIQALFGFQMMAVFSEGFSSELGTEEQWFHLAAVAFVVIAIGLVMAPAAYHRQTSPEHVTDHFIRLGSRLILCSMFPLAVAVCLDVFLIARVITKMQGLSAILALLLLLVFLGLWVVLPWWRKSQTRRRPMP